jgi:hypothetical protein
MNVNPRKYVIGEARLVACAWCRSHVKGDQSEGVLQLHLFSARAAHRKLGQLFEAAYIPGEHHPRSASHVQMIVCFSVTSGSPVWTLRCENWRAV